MDLTSSDSLENKFLVKAALPVSVGVKTCDFLLSRSATSAPKTEAEVVRWLRLVFRKRLQGLSEVQKAVFL